MNALGWLSLFSKFADLAEGLLENFIEKYPELKEGPKEPNDTQIDNRIDELISAKFPKSDHPYDDEEE